MIRIFSDMDRYIQDYKIQRQMAENKKSIQPLSDVNGSLVKNATYPHNAYKLGFSN